MGVVRTVFSAALMGAVLGIFPVQAEMEPAKDDLYYGFSRVDPQTRTVTPDSFVIVRNGKISQMGTGTPPEGKYANRHDLTGTYGMPGLIDAHAHIASAAHTVEMKDGAPLVQIGAEDEITQHNGKVALAFGVTTVRNPGGQTAHNARYDEMVRSGRWAGPDAFHAGAVIQPPPFGGASFAYPETDEEWHAEARRQAKAGMSYFKLYTDLTEAQLATGIEAAHAHGLKAIAHLNGVSWTRAAQLGIDGLEHALPTSPDLLEPGLREVYISKLGPDSKFMYRWFEFVNYDGPLMQDLFKALKDNGTVLNMTLLVNELVYNTDDLDRVYTPEAQNYLHPRIKEHSLNFLRASAAGWTAEDYDRARAVFPKVLEFVRRLHAADIPLMIGTDGYGGGPQYARELAHHVAAGIPVWEVLALATHRTAAAMGLEDKTGHLTPGLEADLVFLRENPVEDVRAVRSVHLVVTNGNAYCPEKLLKGIKR